MQVVFVHVQAEQLWNHVGHCPLRAEDLRQTLYIIQGCLSYREDAVAQPSDANWV